MADKRGQEDREWHHFGWKDRLGDKAGVIEQRGGRPLHRLAEQEPGQHSSEQEQRIVAGLAGWQLLMKADAEYESPARQENQRMNDPPEPARYRAHETLLEISPN